MSARQMLHHWLAVARRREGAIALSAVSAAIPVLAAAGWRLAGVPAAALAAIVVLLAAWPWVMRARRRLDDAWLIRQLDGRYPQLENSSDLLLSAAPADGTLAALQRARIDARLSQLRAVDLRRPWPWRRLCAAWMLSLALAAAAVFWPSAAHVAATGLPDTRPAATAPSEPIALRQARLDIAAPAYTGLAPRSQNALAAKFPEGSRLRWRLGFSRAPAAAALVFFDGQRVPLAPGADGWTATRVIAASDVYRIEVDGKTLQPEAWHRLDAVKDLPPQLRVMQPDRSLSLVQTGQRAWALALEAEDDYGLGAATLDIQLAQGSGENVRFTAFSRPLAGQGGNARRRYATTLDLAQLGMAVGDDLIVRFGVKDRRQGTPNETQSAAYILRWPAEDTFEASGVEGLLKKVMPAYFRSQRQIIIDTEKLLAQRGRLDRDTFAVRSDTIGVDQRILRLRYGQFLGEETEGVQAAKPAEDGAGEAHHAEDGHDHGEQGAAAKKAPPSAAATNQAVLEEFGHTHDIPEAATLLDPETKRLLRAALNEMWRAELHLRSGEPKLALPYEYRALDFIKQVQQASRIYLARVGTELPPIDEGRRLTGDRSGVIRPADSLQAANRGDAPVFAFWQALDGGEPDFGALRAWLTANPESVPDALGLKVAMDEAQRKPACQPCRARLKALLWPVLPAPLAAPVPRPAADGPARTYRELLRRERER